MPDASEARIRSRAAQSGFSGAKAETKVENLSGGEKARLLLGVSSFHAPHLLILDEPTNHLDIDSRAALIEAINIYSGAVILVSHDRYLLDACADKLWIVYGGSVKTFDGDMDDYSRYVLAATRGENSRDNSIGVVKPAQQAVKKQDLNLLRRKLTELETKIEKFNNLLSRIDSTLSEPEAYSRNPQEASKLSSQRTDLTQALSIAEEQWLEIAAQIDNG